MTEDEANVNQRRSSPWRWWHHTRASRHARRGRIAEAVRCYLISCAGHRRTAGNRLVSDARAIIREEGGDVELAKSLWTRAGDLGEPIGFSDLALYLKDEFQAGGAQETRDQAQLVNSWLLRGAALRDSLSICWLLSRLPSNDASRAPLLRQQMAALAEAGKDDTTTLRELALLLQHIGKEHRGSPADLEWVALARQLSGREDGVGWMLLGIAFSSYSRVDVDRDAAEAARCYHRAIQSPQPGSHMPGSLCRLARLYEDGDGVEKDDKVAIRLYERSAALGELHALQRLGQIHRKRGDDLLEYFYHRRCGQTYYEKSAAKLRRNHPELLVPYGRFEGRFWALVPTALQARMVAWMLVNKSLGCAKVSKDIALLIAGLICTKM